LDGVKRILDKSMLVISDPKKAIAIAGVMGGKNSEVSQNIKKIILESANFYGINIRKTSTKLGLKTDAVTRFEKNIDSNLTITTTNRAVELLEKYANAKVASKICDVYKSLPKPKKITLTKQKLENYLGVKIPDRKVVSIFSSLELQAKQKRDKFEVEIPTFRRDLNLEVDLVEEVARIYGYDKFPTELPESTTAPPDYNPLLKISYKIKKILTIKGFTEVYNYPLVSKDLIEKINFNPKDHLKLRNIITPEQEYFVQSLVPKLLENINKNLGFFDEVKIFEIGTCFYPKKDEVLPSEEQHLTIVLAISEKEKNESFYLTKGILELLLDHLKIKNVDFKEIKEQHPFLDENRSALICSGKNILGEIGEIKPEIQARFDIQKKVIIFDLELEKLIANASKENPYKPPTKFPAVKLDLAILVNKNIPYKDIEEGIRKAEKDILVKIELFDVYQGKQIAKSKKSLAFHLTFQSNKKTLKLEEAQTRLEKIINSLKKEFDIGLRK
ncbi:phenylalanine--tRNA ligase subunit beta, partial [bacterium (Candidatus Torokbacteria) CG_4_10_14_0_2_um_filter_35_8]